MFACSTDYWIFQLDEAPIMVLESETVLNIVNTVPNAQNFLLYIAVPRGC